MIRAIGRPLAVVSAATLICGVTAAMPASAATTGRSDNGLFGAADPTYDGAYRQSLALLAFAAAGQTPPAASVDWLESQQCASGGWQAYRADVSVACAPSNATTYSGPDTNSTAIAVEALAALGQQPRVDPTAFLASSQTTAGGFGYYTGADADPNSTALVVQALIASHLDPSAASWTKQGNTPLSYLISQQVRTCTTVGEYGGIASPFSGGHPDAFASLQTVPALAQKAFPLTPVSSLTSPPASGCPTASPSGSPSPRPSASPSQSPVDPATATRFGAGYLDSLIGQDGSVAAQGGAPSVSNTAYAVLALSAAGAGDDAKRRAGADWLLNHGVPATANPAKDNPGELALVVLADLSVGDASAPHAARISPTTVDNILARIAATARVVTTAAPSATPTPTAASPSTTASATSTQTASPATLTGSLPLTGADGVDSEVLLGLTLLAAGSACVVVARSTRRGRHQN